MKVRHWLWGLGLLGGGLGLGFFVIKSQGATRLEAAQAEARRVPDPLHVQELRRGRSDGPDPGPWLVKVAQSQARWTLQQLLQVGARDNVLTRLESGELGDMGVAAARQLRNAWSVDGAGLDANWTSMTQRLEARLEGSAGIEPWLDSERALLHVLALGGEPLVNLAAEADGLGAIDPQAVLAALPLPEHLFPHLPVLQEVELARACKATALSGALRQDAGVFLAGLRGAIALSKIHDNPDWLTAGVLHTAHAENLCSLLELCISVMPREWDLTEAEGALGALRLREAARRSVAGERAFGLRVWDHYTPSEQLATGWWDRWLAHTWLASDKAAYLERFQVVLHQLRSEAHQRNYTAWPAPQWYLIRTRLLLPPLTSFVDTVDHAEARTRLAQGALVAWRGGAKEALPWFTASVDPYDGKPMRVAINDTGLVQLWCTGPDRRDDDGTLDKDVVWRMHLR
jgi:hypothetical protein